MHPTPAIGRELYDTDFDNLLPADLRRRRSSIGSEADKDLFAAPTTVMDGVALPDIFQVQLLILFTTVSSEKRVRAAGAGNHDITSLLIAWESIASDVRKAAGVESHACAFWMAHASERSDRPLRESSATADRVVVVVASAVRPGLQAGAPGDRAARPADEPAAARHRRRAVRRGRRRRRRAHGAARPVDARAVRAPGAAAPAPRGRGHVAVM